MEMEAMYVDDCEEEHHALHQEVEEMIEEDMNEESFFIWWQCLFYA
jgi:hypothetical protein